MRRKKINVYPYDFNFRSDGRGFCLEFVGPQKEGTFDRHVVIVLHFEPWWVGTIASALWKFIRRERERVAELEQDMTERR